ncbi:MAG: hypothetical protein J07HQW1_02433 [Haloquadratum walsbyi J07HQW1]|uniref:Uncharacterized protein n=1 Tax=Haloquadratum walsbyi J07HQW1 TaxID=1238424 RepID=U1N6W6_9EURY|nr:MAG: hypothetical protein J07HQW1_02433 [Haloquadratum walsbyi J07HQW1]
MKYTRVLGSDRGRGRAHYPDLMSDISSVLYLEFNLYTDECVKRS